MSKAAEKPYYKWSYQPSGFSQFLERTFFSIFYHLNHIAVGIHTVANNNNCYYNQHCCYYILPLRRRLQVYRFCPPSPWRFLINQQWRMNEWVTESLAFICIQNHLLVSASVKCEVNAPQWTHWVAQSWLRVARCRFGLVCWCVQQATHKWIIMRI